MSRVQVQAVSYLLVLQVQAAMRSKLKYESAAEVRCAGRSRVRDHSSSRPLSERSWTSLSASSGGLEEDWAFSRRQFLRSF